MCVLFRDNGDELKKLAQFCMVKIVNEILVLRLELVEAVIGVKNIAKFWLLLEKLIN